MKRHIVQQKSVIDRITRIIKYNGLSAIDKQRIEDLQSKHGDIYKLDQNLFDALKVNPYYYFQLVTDKKMSILRKITT